MPENLHYVGVRENWLVFSSTPLQPLVSRTSTLVQRRGQIRKGGAMGGDGIDAVILSNP